MLSSATTNRKTIYPDQSAESQLCRPFSYGTRQKIQENDCVVLFWHLYGILYKDLKLQLTSFGENFLNRLAELLAYGNNMQLKYDCISNVNIICCAKYTIIF